MWPVIIQEFILGIARLALGIEDLQPGRSAGIAAGLIGLGFDYYVSQNSMVRFEYTYIGGEDSFSTNMLSLGFRYNFN